MAMLAEPRRKVRYIVNPTGKDWTEQQGGANHFGQRMLRTMGWREGQGLGKDNQGSSEPIHVKRKSDQRGVGCSSAYAAETMPQSVDFASLLSQLNADHGGCGLEGGQINAAAEDCVGGVHAKTRVGLEAKSKSSRARVHYHKFTRGKDVSAYDSQSLACIFGSRAASSKTSMGETVVGAAGAEAADVDEVVADDPQDSEFPPAGFGFQQAMRHSRSANCLATTTASESQHGLQLVHSQTSLQDYFKDKMRELQERRATKQQQQQRQPDCDEAAEDRTSWTCESSCSVASTSSSTSSSSSSSPRNKRTRFDLEDDKVAEIECRDSGSVVIDLGLFPGCDFHRVLGYPLY